MRVYMIIRLEIKNYYSKNFYYFRNEKKKFIIKKISTLLILAFVTSRRHIQEISDTRDVPMD